MDGLWDIQIYKKKRSPLNYPETTIHPGLYPARMQSVNSIVEAKNLGLKNKVSKLPREFRQFEALINDNIDDNIIAK